MADLAPGEVLYRQYNLVPAQQTPLAREPVAHQQEALTKLAAWYSSRQPGPRGGMLVLPTGGGKTFTAIHFLCGHPLSDGYKVLWLAHTHHLLEQAFFAFGHLVGLITGSRQQLNVRVVSGTPGHFPVHTVRDADDVVVGTLQTLSGALGCRHPSVELFLASTGGKLFVVFDEAHHAPAPSYRKLLIDLRERFPAMRLLGLTATPTYTEERKRGWLLRLFPQGILYQVEPKRLMAAGVLSRPIIEEASTSFEPPFDERDYEKWVGSNRDLPEEIISDLATKRERNDFIVGHYLANREKYGKTIIFADRWFQCEYLREKLSRQGVRADAVYSHVDADPGSAAARNRRTADENGKVLRRFREGQLDVLINVRMLTEGTDVPDVRTVFLTRQTTSQILLTQMVGRALRGPSFGGTDRAYIVSFIDNWKQRINWAAFEQIAPGQADDSAPEYGKRPPLQLISIELVRRLARQMDSGANVSPAPYSTHLPVGWYRVEYYARVGSGEDIEPAGGLVMVFEDERPCFTRLIEALGKEDLHALEPDDLRIDAVQDRIDGWLNGLFGGVANRVGGGLPEDVFSVARHMAQNERQAPRFFEFDARKDHDLDAVAGKYLADRLDRLQEDEALHGEYSRGDRFWRVLYPRYDQFKSHYDACVNRILHAARRGTDSDAHRLQFTTPEDIPDREPSEAVKLQVKSRDGFRCLCCGNTARRYLVVDHIYASYYGGNNDLDNLQTLCKVCNDAKRTLAVNFRLNRTPLTGPPADFPQIDPPEGEYSKCPEQWEMFLRHSVNLFYRCAAVDAVSIGRRGQGFRNWQIKLFTGNDARWLKPQLGRLVKRIREAREGPATKRPLTRSRSLDDLEAPVAGQVFAAVNGRVAGRYQNDS